MTTGEKQKKKSRNKAIYSMNIPISTKIVESLCHRKVETGPKKVEQKKTKLMPFNFKNQGLVKRQSVVYTRK